MFDPQATRDALLGALFAASDVAYEIDLRHDTIRWHGPLAALSGTDDPRALASGTALKTRINPADLPKRTEAIAASLHRKAGYDCEFRLRRVDGRFAWIHDRGTAHFDETGEPVRLIGVMRVIDRRKQVEAELEHRANFDELTGLYNAKRLRESIAELLAQSMRYGGPAAFLIIGLDKLSLIHEGLGEAAAESAVLQVAQRLEGALRASDIMGRLNNDQFGVVLSRCPEGHVAAVCEKLLDAFRSAPVDIAQGRVQLSISIGAVAFPIYAQTVNDILTRADMALRQAQNRGGDDWVNYRWSIDQQQRHHRSIEVGEAVVGALKAGRIRFAYQPIVHAATGKTALYECLLRMVGEDDVEISAGYFMPMVEELGLTRLIDRFTLGLARADLESYPNINLGLNISALTVSDKAILRQITGMLRDRPSIANRLIIEITETAAMQDMEESIRFVHAVRDLGARVAIDDFGAGYTSFSHLRALSIDILKIDGSFVRHIAQSPTNQMFVRSLIELARGFGLQTIAEFVETEEDAAFLADAGVDLLQGYYYSKPLSEPVWRSSLEEAAPDGPSAITSQAETETETGTRETADLES